MYEQELGKGHIILPVIFSKHFFDLMEIVQFFIIYL